MDPQGERVLERKAQVEECSSLTNRKMNADGPEQGQRRLAEKIHGARHEEVLIRKTSTVLARVSQHLNKHDPKIYRMYREKGGSEQKPYHQW